MEVISRKQERRDGEKSKKEAEPTAREHRFAPKTLVSQRECEDAQADRGLTEEINVRGDRHNGLKAAAMGD